jgi:cytoskeletal protein CcmA (bactofilin family)
MKIKLSILAGMVLCFNIPLSAMVIHNYCSEKDESIKTESGKFNDDYLFLGHELTFSGEAEDLVFLGKRLTFSGKTKLGLIALCEDLVYSGLTGNGIVAGGMNVSIDGTINGNNYVGCRSFTLSDRGAVNGNIFVGCAKLTIDGTVNGDIYAGAGKIVINNVINGNVTAYGGRIVIGERGKINGNLRYSANEKLSDAEAAKVAGSISIDKNFKWESLSAFKKNSIGFLIGMGLFLSYIMIASLLLFIPVFGNLDGKQSAKDFWLTSMWGIIPVLMYPAIVVLCLILVFTIPLGFMLLLACIPLFFIANIIGTTLVGKYLVTKLKWNVEKKHYQFLVGVVAGGIISIIPFINFLSFLFFTALGWGVFLSFLFNKDSAVEQ